MNARQIFDKAMSYEMGRKPINDIITWARSEMAEHGVTAEQMIEAWRDRIAERKFEEFQERIRASARIVTEADLYWRANRWDATEEETNAES